MKKVWLLRPSYFVWLPVLLLGAAVLHVAGLPHVIWSYAWRDNGASYGDIAGRYYTRCTYVGPFGAFTEFPDDGRCGLIRFFRAEGDR